MSTEAVHKKLPFSKMPQPAKDASARTGSIDRMRTFIKLEAVSPYANVIALPQMLSRLTYKILVTSTINAKSVHALVIGDLRLDYYEKEKLEEPSFIFMCDRETATFYFIEF